MEGATESHEDVDGLMEVPPPAPQSVKRAPAPQRLSSIELADEASLRDWMTSLAGEAEIKVNIARKKPLVGPGGENISGSLETVTDRIDEDYLRETWGGGTFMIRVQAATPAGDYKFVKGGQRQIVIAGPPKMHGMALGLGPVTAVATAAEDGLAERAFNAMERNAREQQQRADQLQREQHQRSPGLDVAALQALNGPLIEQLKTAQETIAQMQVQMLAMSNKPAPRDEFRDRLMERAIEGESGRIEALRAQYENRIEKLRDSHDDQIKRLEDRHAGDIKRLEDRHERELRNYEKTAEGQTKSTDFAFQARLDSLKDDKVRLERELTAAATRIATLEARKDQTITEKADELLKVQEALEGLGGGKDDKEEAWYEKLIGTVGSLPAVTGMLEKLTGPAPQQAQPGQQQLPPPGVPFQNGDGNIYVRDAAGNVSIVDQQALRQQRAIAAARKRKKQAAQAAAGGAPANDAGEVDPLADGLAEEPGAEAEPVGRAPDAGEVKMAVNFMENALRAGATPESFGATARNLMPTDILAYIQRVGPEEFLNKTARLDAGSPLASVRGREFCRKVFKYLVGDTTE